MDAWLPRVASRIQKYCVTSQCMKVALRMPYSRRAGIYEVEYVEDRDYAFVDGLLDRPGLRVLEVPCGVGRLSSRLARKAADLMLVDIEPVMVEKAAKAAAAASSTTCIRTTTCDMRTLDLDAAFDVALVPREALQLLSPDDGKKAISAIGRHIVVGGLLFVDLATFRATNGPLTDPDYFDPGRGDGTWQVDWMRDLADGFRLVRHSAQWQEADSILIELSYEIANPRGVQDSWRSQMRLFRYDRDWLDSAPADGMVLEAVYGDYDRSSFSDASPRMLAMYRRAH
ncbi:class I SAM-dependent methyltransferase [Sinorhizobium meliloti]|uniref:class I SAM-dependent methyltransferase n=2 Tax=Rhizobium meliloti TaxID=382 RepID=UPI000FD8C034|nr:class I SAM-dependent methyltransferase [Sinorhizobium meliloti]RVI32110.1 class I SAM-dependent methyltransferase [Sinorhizobium meliloti]RVI43971.1 class I SAM-dependent methyltransferase [Sinorhizobium meliloti]RVO95356.1 class I SAM-dependent methyltransferase [Sinorhizobium meliloti]